MEFFTKWLCAFGIPDGSQFVLNNKNKIFITAHDNAPPSAAFAVILDNTRKPRLFYCDMYRDLIKYSIRKRIRGFEGLENGVPKESTEISLLTTTRRLQKVPVSMVSWDISTCKRVNIVLTATCILASPTFLSGRCITLALSMNCQPSCKFCHSNFPYFYKNNRPINTPFPPSYAKVSWGLGWKRLLIRRLIEAAIKRATKSTERNVASTFVYPNSDILSFSSVVRLTAWL